jgi:hypothetical protein
MAFNSSNIQLHRHRSHGYKDVGSSQLMFTTSTAQAIPDKIIDCLELQPLPLATVPIAVLGSERHPAQCRGHLLEWASNHSARTGEEQGDQLQH